MKPHIFFKEKFPKVNRSLLVTPLVLFLGIILALSFRGIRYTPLLSPVIVNINPSIAYENIVKSPENYMLIDVRSEYEYYLAHASTSVSIPINELYDGWKELPLNKGKTIYLMCTSGKLAGIAYGFLEHQGFRNIKRIEGGLEQWKIKGLPIIIANTLNSSSTTHSLNKGLDIPFR